MFINLTCQVSTRSVPKIQTNKIRTGSRYLSRSTRESSFFSFFKKSLPPLESFFTFSHVKNKQAAFFPVSLFRFTNIQKTFRYFIIIIFLIPFFFVLLWQTLLLFLIKFLLSNSITKLHALSVCAPISRTLYFLCSFLFWVA